MIQFAWNVSSQKHEARWKSVWLGGKAEDKLLGPLTLM